MLHCGNDETGQNPLCGRYLNHRRTGKDATKPRTLGLLGHSVILNSYSLILKSSVGVYNFITNVYIINYKSTSIFQVDNLCKDEWKLSRDLIHSGLFKRTKL